MKRITAILLLLLASPVWAGWTEFYVRSTGSNLNAGSTNTDAATVTYANGSWVQSTGVFTVASGNPSSDGVLSDGTMWASVYITSGATQTGFVGRITGVSSTTITVSLSIKGGTAPADGTTNTTLKVNGAWAGPSGAVGFPYGFVHGAMVNPAGDMTHVNWGLGTWVVTAGMSHTNSDVYFEGYGTTPGDDAGRPIIQGPTTGTRFTLLNTIGATGLGFENFIFENNGNSGTTSGIYLLAVDLRGLVRNSIFRNGWGSGLYNDDDAIIYEVECYNNSLGADSPTLSGLNLNISGSAAIRPYLHNNRECGVKADGGVFLYRGIVANNTGDGLGSTGNVNQFCQSSDFVGNGDSGVHLGLGDERAMNTNYWNCNFITNAGYGFESEGQPTPGLMFGNTMGIGGVANTLGGFEHDKWYISLLNDTTSTTPYQNSAGKTWNITGASANETGYAVWTQIHPSYSGTVGVIDRGAAQQ